MDKAIYEIISMIITVFFALAAAILGSLYTFLLTEQRNAKKLLYSAISDLFRFEGEKPTQCMNEIRKSFRKIRMTECYFLSYRRFYFYKKRNLEIADALDKLRDYFLGDDRIEYYDMEFDGIDFNKDNHPIYNALYLVGTSLSMGLNKKKWASVYSKNSKQEILKQSKQKGKTE